ncbi:MAG: transglutaminase domain-containing protein [Ferruginibacter sp.]
MKQKVFTLITVLFFSWSLMAQDKENKYNKVDEFVTNLGALTDKNVSSIADTLTRALSSNELKARAIFFWIANNITLDAKAIKSNDNRKTLPEEVIKNRKSSSLGFAKLFQEMSSIANIRCLVVDGFVKNNVEEINDPADEVNYSWNVLQLGQSPEQWYYIDAAKASGTLDKKMSGFIKDFTGEYFFADRILFNLDHYPNNGAWQLGPGPKSKKEFYALPLFYNAAYTYGFKKLAPAAGFIKTKVDAKVLFSIPYTSSKSIGSVSLLMGDGKRAIKPEPMNFTSSNAVITFSYQFKTQDSFPVKVQVNENTVLEYMVEVN